jgi:lysophospholipase L1-like esterase
MSSHTVLPILIYLTFFCLVPVNSTFASPKKFQDNPPKELKPVPAFTVDGREETKFQIIGANDPRLYYIGRIDDRDLKAPVFIWQGTEVRARFSGKFIGLRFSNAWGQNFYNVIIDGQIWVLQLNEWGTHDYLLAQELPEGLHELIVVKRTEAYYGAAVFGGLILGKDGELETRPSPLPLRIEFYGDSITAGACNENPPDTEQYDDVLTHNNYRSYGAITARNLNAEYVCIAVSGIGMCYSWNSFRLPEIYDRLYLNLPDARYNFKGRKPDIVLLNVGQNDFGYTRAMEKEFPDDFAEKYVELVRKIRGLYPSTFIVCSIGGMSAYNDSPELQSAFQKAVAELKTTDKKLTSFVFKAFTYMHPRVDTHAKMAEELTVFLQKEVLGK